MFPVELTVNVELPVAPAREVGLNEHVGGAEVARVPPRVMLLQEKVTAALNPAVDAAVMVEVAELPAVIVAGERVVAETVKFSAACTTRDTEALCASEPEVPVILIRYVPAALVAVVVMARANLRNGPQNCTLQPRLIAEPCAIDAFGNRAASSF